MRLFVAIYPPPEVIHDITEQIRRLRVGEAAASGINVRLLNAEHAHVTLAFLGDVEEDRLPDVEAALTRAVYRRVVEQHRAARRAERQAARWAERSAGRETGPGVGQYQAVPTSASAGRTDTGPIRLRLGGGGRFGRGRFTVLWAGVQGDVAALGVLARTIRSELRRARLPYDERPFKPHFTIARPDDRVDRVVIDEDRATLDGYLGPSWPVTEIALVRSHLGPRPLYHHIATWPL